MKPSNLFFGTHFRFLLVCTTFGIASLAFAGEQKISITALGGLPHPLNLAVDFRLVPAFHIGVAGGYLSLDIPGSSPKVGVSLLNVEGRAVWHPFSGSFVLGTGMGFHKITGSANQNISVAGQTVPTQVTAGLKAPYLKPHLGWIFIGDSGFTFGLEMGAMAPLTSSSSLDVAITDPTKAAYFAQVTATDAYQSLKTSTEKDINTLGKQIFPYAAVRLGWSF